MSIIDHTVGLLVVAIAVALIARRLALPYTVGLVIAGILLALTQINTGVRLTHDLIFNIILPPLLFEAAINIHWRELSRDALPVFTLALFGTIISAAAVAAGLVWLLRWPLTPALLFGALIAATDPVAVIAMFKDNRVTGRLRLLVECESLFNDGVAAVLFTLVLASLAGGGPAGGIAPMLLRNVGGGMFIGLACAVAVILAAGRTSDHLVESALTTVAAYGSFLLAQHFGASGVLACVTAGLLIGNLAILPDGEASAIALEGREFVLDLWEFIAFLANSLVFLLIGLTVAGIPMPGSGLLRLACIICFVLVARAITVYPLCLAFAWSRWNIPLRAQHVLWWGGLRGALALALALSLPDQVPMRDDILIAAFAVVVFSVIVQGLTMPWLLRRAE